MNYLFIDPQLPGLDTITRHEEIHIRDHHTADILFFELLQAVNWFNPVTFFLKREIKAIHEFIADDRVLHAGMRAETYSLFLIRNSSQLVSQKLSNQMFNGRLLKMRIVKMHQKRSLQRAKWKYALVTPVLLLVVCLSSATFTKPYGIDLMPQKRSYVRSSDISRKSKAQNRGTALHQPVHEQVEIDPKKKSTPLTETTKGHRVSQEKSESIYIDARTDTVKITSAPDKAGKGDNFKGIYVVDNKVYTRQQLQNTLKQTGKMNIVVANRPEIGIYTPNSTDAIKRWGKRARDGVLFVLPRKDTTSNPAGK